MTKHDESGRILTNQNISQLCDMLTNRLTRWWENQVAERAWKNRKRQKYTETNRILNTEY
jgi:hypothetical protein